MFFSDRYLQIEGKKVKFGNNLNWKNDNPIIMEEMGDEAPIKLTENVYYMVSKHVNIEPVENDLYSLLIDEGYPINYAFYVFFKKDCNVDEEIKKLFDGIGEDEYETVR